MGPVEFSLQSCCRITFLVLKIYQRILSNIVVFLRVDTLLISQNDLLIFSFEVLLFWRVYLRFRVIIGPHLTGHVGKWGTYFCLENVVCAELSSKPWRHIEEWRYSSTYSCSRHLFEGWLAALFSGKGSSYPLVGGWAGSRLGMGSLEKVFYMNCVWTICS